MHVYQWLGVAINISLFSPNVTLTAGLEREG